MNIKTIGLVVALIAALVSTSASASLVEATFTGTVADPVNTNQDTFTANFIFDTSKGFTGGGGPGVLADVGGSSFGFPTPLVSSSFVAFGISQSFSGGYFASLTIINSAQGVSFEIHAKAQPDPLSLLDLDISSTLADVPSPTSLNSPFSYTALSWRRYRWDVSCMHRARVVQCSRAHPDTDCLCGSLRAPECRPLGQWMILGDDGIGAARIPRRKALSHTVTLKITLLGRLK